MADSKISALPAATTPLAGTEVIPIVQSGVTDQVTVANLTAGRAVATAALSATGIVLTTDATDATSTTAAAFKTAGGLAVVKKTYIGDNIVQGVAAKGINFTANTPAAGMTSQLLNWYEEGIWTPVLSRDGTAPTGITYSTQSGRYTRVGRQVNAYFDLIISAITTQGTGNWNISGFPFNVASIRGIATIGLSGAFTTDSVGYAPTGSAIMFLVKTGTLDSSSVLVSGSLSGVLSYTA